MKEVPPPPPKPFATLAETARITGLSKHAIKELIAKDQFPDFAPVGTNQPRFVRAKVLAWLKQVTA